MRKVCFILLLYLSLYDFYSVKIQPRACSMPLSWTVVEYHSQSHWAKKCLQYASWARWHWLHKLVFPYSLSPWTNLDQIWESQNIGDTNKFMLLFKESIVRIFTQQWRKDIESSSKLRTYALVKKYFCV